MLGAHAACPLVSCTRPGPISMFPSVLTELPPLANTHRSIPVLTPRSAIVGRDRFWLGCSWQISWTRPSDAQRCSLRRRLPSGSACADPLRANSISPRSTKSSTWSWRSLTTVVARHLRPASWALRPSGRAWPPPFRISSRACRPSRRAVDPTPGGVTPGSRAVDPTPGVSAIEPRHLRRMRSAHSMNLLRIWCQLRRNGPSSHTQMTMRHSSAWMLRSTLPKGFTGWSNWPTAAPCTSTFRILSGTPKARSRMA